MEMVNEEPRVIIMSIGKTFYANVPNVVDNKAIIRGELVPFDAFDMNSFYGMRYVKQGKYEAYFENMDYKEVIQVLIIKGVK